MRSRRRLKCSRSTSKGWAEDGPLPVARTIAQLMTDPRFREAMEGAMVVLVPYAPPARAVRVNTTIDESLLARIDRAAEAAGETRSGFIAEACKTRLAGAAARSTGDVLELIRDLAVAENELAMAERQVGKPTKAALEAMAKATRRSARPSKRARR